MTSRIRVLQETMAATGLLFIAAALTASGTSGGYEISIYDQMPLLFWITIVLAFCLYSLGLMQASLEGQHALVTANLLGLSVLNCLLLATPVLRYGTYYTQWDVWFHLGYTTDIIKTTRVNLDSNFYPALHLLWASSAQITGLSVTETGLFLGPLLASLNVPILYFLSARAFKSPSVGAAIAILGAVPNGTVGMDPAPWFYSLTVLVLLFYSVTVRQQRPGVSTTVPTLLLATALAVAHPIMSILAGLTFALITWFPPLVQWTRGRLAFRPVQLSRAGYPRSGTFLAYTLVIYFSWIAFLTLALRISVEKFLLAVQVGGVINSVQYGRFLTLPLLLKLYGASGIVGIYWALGVRKLLKLAELGIGAQIAIFSVAGSVVLAIVFENVAAGLGVGESAFLPLTAVSLLLPIGAGWYLSTRADAHGKATRRHLAVVMAGLLPFMIASAAMYPSPYVSLFNYQNTNQVYAAVDWGANSLPDKYQILSNSHVGRYAYFPLQSQGAQYLKLFHWENTIPRNMSLFLRSSANVSYLILDKETLLVAGMDLRAWSFPSPTDVTLLNEWQHTARIYDNGEVQVYLVSSPS